jgi:5-formyltetrahydrofolate cyclo-ligase
MDERDAPDAPAEVLRHKAELRSLARRRRRELPDKDLRSRQIWEWLRAMPGYAAAAAVMLYLDFGDEVRTRPFLPDLWREGKQTLVPYCEGLDLRLFRLEDPGELAAGTLGILEPRQELRGRGDRRAEPAELDLVLLPGVAFDRSGRRLGQGRGYYDRFLPRVRPAAPLVALAFDCQVFDRVPALPHDVPVDRIVTESGVYPAEGKD